MCGSAPDWWVKNASPYLRPNAPLVAIGAVHVRTLYADEENESCIPMLDIEGNEFCID
ncbi:hypothetical protein SMICM17S_10211 [Streptomyces microflavus]